MDFGVDDNDGLAGTEVVLKVRGVSKSFGSRRGHPGTQVLDQVELDVRTGEIVVLVGASGCGKTTLLRSIAGLETPDAGQVVINGRTVFDHDAAVAASPDKRDLGMVFQDYALWPHMTVGKNVDFPLRMRRATDEHRRRRLRAVLELVECEDFTHRYPKELSGGQQQRIAVARALAAEPSLLLFDEPLSNLDARLRKSLRSELRLLHAEVKFSAVYVTHDQAEALALGDKVAVMRAGRIEQLGTPETVHEWPATSFVAQFMGGSNVLPLAADASGTLVRTDGVPVARLLEASQSGKFELVARSDQLGCQDSGVSNPDESCARLGRGVVADRVFEGLTSELQVELGDEFVSVTVPSSDSRRPGDIVELYVLPHQVRVFSCSTGEAHNVEPLSAGGKSEVGSLSGGGVARS